MLQALANVLPLCAQEPSFDHRTVFVLSGPSGSGKTTLRQALIDNAKNEGELPVHAILSYTTRPERDEVSDKDYLFKDRSDFMEASRKGALAVLTFYDGHYYGLPSSMMNPANLVGSILILDHVGKEEIKSIAKAMDLDVVTFQILPPSETVQRQRLTKRTGWGADKRLTHEKELHPGDDDYVLINKDWDRTMAELRRIMMTEALNSHAKHNGRHASSSHSICPS